MTPEPLFSITTPAYAGFREHTIYGVNQARVDSWLVNSRGAMPAPIVRPCGLLTTIRQMVSPDICAESGFPDSWLDLPVHAIAGSERNTLCSGRVILAFYQFVNGDSMGMTRRPAYLVHDTSFGADCIRLVQSA